MSHTFYNTKCIVLRGADFGEANKYIFLFTKEIGLVKAFAKSVREERSKLRYSLQDFSFTNVTLVHGKEVWRITGAQEVYNLYREIAGDIEKLYAISQILNLLKVLIHGEERNDYLFNVLSDGFDYLRACDMNKESIKNCEHLLALRVLFSLGYIANKDIFKEMLSSTEVNDKLLLKTRFARKEVVSSINNALKESHL